MARRSDSLTDLIKELVELQKQATRGSIRIEAAVVQPVEAQTATFKILGDLGAGLKATRRDVGGLTHTVGFGLEDVAFKALPALLERDFGASLHGRLKSEWVTDNQGKEVEVDIFGRASKGDREVVIVGESKSRLSLDHVKKFEMDLLRRLDGVYGEIVPVLVTYRTSSSRVEAYAKERKIALYYSYDF